MQVINQLFEEITKEYSLQILKWAYKKCGDGYRAEELTQEVLTQVFTAIQKNREVGKTIGQMEHFIWRIAHYVWCHSLRGSARFVMCSMEEDSLIRQNICIACYQQPKNLDELTTLLGIPKAYLEFDLKWLVEHEFVDSEKGKYRTIFYINSRSEMQKSYGIHCSLKEQVCDVIVNGLMEAEDTIRKIGFHGSDVPMDKLLWYLIYVFSRYFQEDNEDNSVWMNKPVRPGGGKYYPLGYIEDEEDITEWALDNRGFAYSGYMTSYSFF